MYVSVTKDVRFYGTLKTMGTTPKQLRRIVNGQVMTMYLIGLPMGLLTAVLTSFVLVPAFGSRDAVISFSPLIYVGGIVFTLLTAYLGASISARKAAKVSPIEAVRYAGENNINMKPHRSANDKPSRMAWRNMFRERKRAFIVLLSLFLGMAVFMGAMSIAGSMDIAGNIDYFYAHDIAISAESAVDTDLGIVGMDRAFIEEIANIPGVIEVNERTTGVAMYDYPQVIVDADEAKGYYVPVTSITGINRAEAEKLSERLENPIDIEAFERGEIVLVDNMPEFYGRGIGDMLYEHFPIGKELYIEIGQQSRIPVNTKIAGYTNDMFRSATGYSIHFGGDLHLIMSNTFLESISGKSGVNYIGINIEEGMEEPVNADISAIVKERGMVMRSALDVLKEMEASRFTMFVLGSTLSGILALIGIFNFINLISVGLLTRKREFAAFESVGMSKRQMRLMLRWEGAIYWILTIAVSITAGTGIAHGLFWLVRNQDPSLLPKFIYPFLPVVVVFSLIVLICTVTPEICYRSIAKSTLVERLREVE